MTAQQDVFAALAADGDDVDRLVADLDEESWERPTPAPGWTIAHQVAHLAATFHMAGTAAAEPDRFRAFLEGLSDSFTANVARAMAPYLALPRPALLARWRAERATTEKALVAVPAGQLLPWLVRPLPAPVLAAAGMMELFGHGQDIADALGVRREHTDRIRHLAEFTARTWDFGYLSRQLPVPPVAPRFELTAPSGARWRLGPDESDQVISGPAVDLCLLATRRRHPDDLALHATGDEARRWLDIAQAYRGPAGEGRRPGQFRAAVA
ncbi:TIGR03084 family metal-binding protein [Micromonospora sp. NPDC050980]|uniref:TIGR03084 family metal-binding protein n=1 Tax=Micromonospora sp. NPDC050980 TaxID=3155161 RepID=UPI00340C55B8